MKNYWKFFVAAHSTPATFIKSFFIMCIASIYALIRISVSGETADVSVLEGIIVLVASIAIVEFVARKLGSRE